MIRGRTALAVLAARSTEAIGRRIGRRGSALPGMVADALDPDLLRRLGGRLDAAVLVSGSNGKTTTTGLITHVLRANGRSVVTNASGANLRQGIVSTIARHAGPRGRLRDPHVAAVFEVDEAALPGLVDDLPAPILVLTNLFRDQLDRFGETDVLVRAWEGALRAAPAGTRLVYCADDPRLAALALVAREAGVATLGFGLAGAPGSAAGGPPDVPTCPSCAEPMWTQTSWLGHLGDFSCPRCGLRRPEPDLTVRVVANDGLSGQTVALQWAGDAHEQLVPLRLPGLVNAYNAAAAVATSSVLGIPRDGAAAALTGSSPAFGRFERVVIEDRHVVLTLVKNPASMAELGRIALDARVDSYVFAMNDAFADGRDTSWYWDTAPAEMLRGRTFAVSGRRAEDFALRLRYALLDDPDAPVPGLLGILDRPADAVARAVGATPVGGTVLVVATYTALMALRVALAASGIAPEIPL